VKQSCEVRKNRNQVSVGECRDRRRRRRGSDEELTYRLHVRRFDSILMTSRSDKVEVEDVQERGFEPIGDGLATSMRKRGLSKKGEKDAT